MRRIRARHWVKWAMLLLVLTVLGGVATAMAAHDGLGHNAVSIWQLVLNWTGLGGASDQTDTVYWCPMHPQIKRTQANDLCPICNMALVRLEGDAREENPEHLELTARQLQQAGVVTEPLLKRELYRQIDTTGRLDYDERSYAGISCWVRGRTRIDHLQVNYTGQFVEQGELMAELYSPDLIVAQEEFLIALKSTSIFSQAELMDAAKRKLQFQGLTPAQVDQLATSGKVLDSVPIYAPISGTVIQRHVQEGQYVQEGEWLFHLADLRHLWLFADVYEEELPLVKLGQSVTLSVRSYPSETFEGTVAFIDPMIQPQTRTVRVRVEIDNRDGRLKPGMYARTQFHAEPINVLAIPENGVIWSGRRAVVLVREAEGLVQPREVRLGQKWLYANESKPGRKLQFGSSQQRYHEVLAGLGLGEEVVTAGAFLLNAESQFQNVLTKMLPAESESVTLEGLLGESLGPSVRELLAAYYELSESLADDQLETVFSRAKALAEVAESLAREADEANQKELAADAGRLAQAAGRLATTAPKDLKEARRGFGSVSRNMMSLLAEHGGKTMLGKELFAFECPMAEEFGYKRWLQAQREMRNPYMGQKMLG